MESLHIKRIIYKDFTFDIRLNLCKNMYFVNYFGASSGQIGHFINICDFENNIEYYIKSL